MRGLSIVRVGVDGGGGHAVEILDGGPVILRGLDAVGREKFFDGKSDSAKERAGIILRAGDAVLVGQAVVVYRHHQLAVPLQAHNGELAQRGQQNAGAVGQDQALPEVGQDGRGDSRDVGHEAGGAGLHHLHVQGDGVHALHHGDGLGIAVGKGPVGAEHLGGALGAEEHDPLVENAKTVHRVLPREGHAGDLVKIGHIHGIVAAVEADLIHVHVRIQERGPGGPYTESALYVRLRRVA